MNFSDKRKILHITGLESITYAINFHRDPNLPDPEVCVPEYIYRVDKTNIDFGTVPTTFFDGGGTKQEDINFFVRRLPDPNCDDIGIKPHVTISPPVGGDVVNTIGNKSMLTNGTTLSLIYLEDNGGEKEMNYGEAKEIWDIGGPQTVPLNADRDIRVRWSKTPGETVKSGRWNATMKYEIYFP